IEVILDVVYNHTGEGSHLGPTLSMRGIDNAAYYRLMPDDARHYMDFTGTGNTLNLREPRVLQLVMDKESMLAAMRNAVFIFVVCLLCWCKIRTI
ncbi:MAG: hypothetical protein WCG34_04850, partial [Leptolinea sp.]